MVMKNKRIKDTTIYQAKNGAIEFRGDFERETIWGNLQQIADLFDVQKPAISKHLKNIYTEGELDKEATISILETVQKEGNRKVKRSIEYYNLDVILSVGYRINSKQATQFRIWATKTLRQHLLQGYTINKKRIGKNYEKFMQAVADVKALLSAGNKIKTEDVLELIGAFAGTWFSLDAYDKDCFPKKGASKKQVEFTAEELSEALKELKKELIKKKEATEIFGQERSKDSIKGIVGSIFQSVFDKDVYPSIEEKAAHLLYFIVKNHPFIDGNKRSGAFAFVWFLRKTGLLRASITPEALTALTLLLAESNSKEKNKMIGLTLLLLNKK
ncbi:MAG: virulence protein RhuM/Fic/DOC family protein [Patescibacteria group bacterium]|nr:virulence protein RhuM/Fic/DOC family protein [Patescibacteria group bacterium]